MRTLAPGVHVVEAPQRFFGLEIGARMTVLETSGGLVVHSPVDMAPDNVACLRAVRWVVAPNTFHHLYVGRWAAVGSHLLPAAASRAQPSRRRVGIPPIPV